MTAGLYFLKLELNYLDDSTFNTVLTDAQRWRYIQLYLLAKKLNEGGTFTRHGHQLTHQDIAWHLHMAPEKLQEDLDALTQIGLVEVNGHGPCLVKFVEEQETAHTAAERIADFRERETEKKHGSNEPVTPRYTESESESDIESESEESQSVQLMTTDDLSTPDLKPELCSQGGIPPKYSRRIIANDQITSEDLLAELARNYSRMGKAKGQVKNPGVITGINLTASPVEKATADWYDHSRWGHLPEPIKKKLGLVIPSGDGDLDNLGGLAIRKEIRGKTVENKVRNWLGGKA